MKVRLSLGAIAWAVLMSQSPKKKNKNTPSKLAPNLPSEASSREEHFHSKQPLRRARPASPPPEPKPDKVAKSVFPVDSIDDEVRMNVALKIYEAVSGAPA